MSELNNSVHLTKSVEDRPWLKFVNKEFTIKGEQVFFIKNPSAGFSPGNNDLMINKLKLFLKKFPRLFNFIYNFFGASFVGKSAPDAIRSVGPDGLVLNLGSGIKRIRKGVLNIDFFPFEGVDIVADITDLPFIDNSVDAIVNEFVLEHLANPEKVVEEMWRVMKPGAILYVAVPFLASFHSSPNDFYRWSRQGLRYLLKDFQEIESGIRCGPTSAFIFVLSEWLSTLFSFGAAKIQQVFFMIFMVCLSPLKLLDLVIAKIPSSDNIAYGFYFIGKKSYSYHGIRLFAIIDKTNKKEIFNHV